MDHPLLENVGAAELGEGRKPVTERLLRERQMRLAIVQRKTVAVDEAAAGLQRPKKHLGEGLAAVFGAEAIGSSGNVRERMKGLRFLQV